MISLSQLNMCSVPAVQDYISEHQLDYFISNVFIDGKLYLFLSEDRSLLHKQIMVSQLKKSNLTILLSDQDKACIIQDTLGNQTIRNQIYKYVGVTNE